MDPRKHIFSDDRFTGLCVYCGAPSGTRDHVPPRVLLDEPYPSQLPIVESCLDCNNSISSDEQYLACLVDSVIAGSTEPQNLLRKKIRRIMTRNDGLRGRLERSHGIDACGNRLWLPETDRIDKVLVKLARGHAAYELYPQLDSPSRVHIRPFITMSTHERMQFEEDVIQSAPAPWPEIGSRAFLRALGAYPGSQDVGE